MNYESPIDGATRLSINTMRAGFATVDEHIAALSAAIQAAPC